MFFAKFARLACGLRLKSSQCSMPVEESLPWMFRRIAIIHQWPARFATDLHCVLPMLIGHCTSSAKCELESPSQAPFKRMKPSRS